MHFTPSHIAIRSTEKNDYRKRNRVTQKIEHETFIHLRVNSLHTLALTDSGANCSCVSLKFAERLKAKIMPTSKANSMRLSAADGHHLISVGTVDLTLTIQGSRSHKNLEL